MLLNEQEHPDKSNNKHLCAVETARAARARPLLNTNPARPDKVADFNIHSYKHVNTRNPEQQ